MTINGNKLSEEQFKPIIDNPKISMIIAGAGSGKTLTIVGKIKYMLDNNLINPDEICVITYTNKAVDSLKGKISKCINKYIDVFTFHKLALTILNKSHYEYNIADSNLLDNIINEFFITKAFNNKTLLKYIYYIFNIIIFKTNYNYKKILKSKELNTFKRIIKSFIYFMNSNDLSNKWNELLCLKKYKKKLLIIYSIYNIYMNELISSNTLDFDRMILLANDIVLNSKRLLPYKLIIIDEFQDTSKLRFNLINSIVKQYNTNLCVVGDDYQAIYKFQGCDLSLFIHFKDYYKDAKIYFLNQTYRNSQELINIAGSFINRNPFQINKKLISNKHLNNPIRIIWYKNEKTILFDLLKNISKDKEVLILGRNNFDINIYLKEYSLSNNNLIINNDDHKIKYMTIHSSKGLESDVVIILNVNNDIYGIPSKVKDDNLLELLKDKDEYLYAEERRLFYVALTRTKSYVYILCNKYKPSIFVKELFK